MLAEQDKLLFKLAYPRGRRQYVQAYEELLGIRRSLLQISSPGQPVRLPTSKKNTSTSTAITGSFSFEISKWLAENFPAHAEIEGVSADAETIRLFFRAILPRTEFESISAGELSLIKRIRKIKGNTSGSLLGWLIRHLEDSGLPCRIKESLFYSLKLFIRWELTLPVFERYFLPEINEVPFLHRKILRKPVFQKILVKKFPGPPILPAVKKTHFIDTARATLSLIYRETEPFTYADINEITCFELERGLTIALYGMKPERKLSIESYVGYLAFKNGIPVAYGGGWIFGHRCQFGINILPPFRGGESALIFYHLLRVYRQYFQAERFVVKPYQFGKNNQEALRSGAFWFYYKAGFRPVNEKLQQRAAREWGKKKINKKHRTSLSLLKSFTGSNMLLDTSKKPAPDMDAAMISTRISAYINQQFDGNRDIALDTCARRTKRELGVTTFAGWNSSERIAFREWSLLAQSVLGIQSWNKVEKNSFIRLIRTKGNSPERDFILQLQQHKRFWKDLSITFR